MIIRHLDPWGQRVLELVASMAKDFAGQAGLHKQTLPARQAQNSAQLKSISGCLYAKACLEEPKP